MKKVFLSVVFFGILFLFFIQMAGTLVESIYILDLMHTSLDAKALGVLFFFTPVLLLPFRRKLPGFLIWSMAILLVLARGMTPYLDTLGRLLASGLGTGAVLLLFPLLVVAKPKGDSLYGTGRLASGGLALAVGFSVLLRTLNDGIDFSLTFVGGWSGWALGLLFLVLVSQMDWTGEPAPGGHKRGLKRAMVGIFLLLALVYFAFSAPAVIARWTEGNYALVVILVSLFSAGWAWVAISQPRLVDRIGRSGLLVWNLAFTACLVGTILAHRVPFPPSAGSAAVVVTNPTWLQQLPLVLMLLLFPVIFFDMRVFVARILQLKPSTGELVPGMLLGGGALVVLVFINIFTNVWGYVPPVSNPFRNMFWLPYLLLSAFITLLAWSHKEEQQDSAQEARGTHWEWAALLAVIVLGSIVGVLQGEPAHPATSGVTSLRVMTFNIQAANDSTGERSYDRQLALIRQVSPDILALQETDTTRISLNNNDYVRYYANRLGYYSYYGPTTITGTFGTTILSKYPLLNTRSVFSYSDQDEIGTAEAEIEVAGHRFTIYDLHPDGSDEAKLTCIQTILQRSAGKADVIIMGDFNLRDYEEAYQLMAVTYTNAWESVYPTKISPDGTDMSGKNRIDHIFFSSDLVVRDPVYLLPPASATDHPVHWAEIFWEK